MKGKQVCSYLKSVRREVASANDIDLEIPDCTFEGECPGTCPRCEAEVRQLEQALSMLPPHEQAIVSMFYYDNMSLADIAFVTGSITSTVGSQLSRIRKKLYRIIKSALNNERT